jgi:hypothetical protein
MVLVTLLRGPQREAEATDAYLTHARALGLRTL